MTRPAAVLGALLAAAALLLGVELAGGARDFGATRVLPACAGHPPFPGDGTDAAIQRIVLDGLDGAACELGAGREELVLSFAPGAGDEVRWDPATVDRVVKAGLTRSIDAARDRDDIGSTTAFILQRIVDGAPVQRLVEGGDWVAGILGDL